MTWSTGMCGSNGHGLTIHVSFMVNVCVCGLWIQWFMTNDAAIPNGWSLQDERHQRCEPLEVGLDCVASVTYGIFSYNGWGTGIVLQVPRDSVNPTKKE